MTDVLVYDATMSVGTQGDGLKLSLPEKLSLVELLDDLGVAYIECGRPGASTNDRRFFAEVSGMQLLNARFVAAGNVRQTSSTPQSDLGLQSLLHADTPVVNVTGVAWKALLAASNSDQRGALLAAVEDSVRFLAERVDQVVFKARHFFDGYVDDADFALEVLNAAAEGGADVIVIADTNGGTLTHHFGEIVTRAKSVVQCPLGVAAHNDADLAVANSLAGVISGASLVRGSVNGFGRRCGNANLISVIPDLELKLGKRCLPDGNLRMLTRVARSVDELANHVPQPQQLPERTWLLEFALTLHRAPF